MRDVRTALAEAARELADASATPRLDAELLMAHALGCDRQAMLMGRLRDPEPAAFAAMLTRRAACEPVAYILGQRGFWTIELEVGPGVLIPRADSETLIEAAVERFGVAGPARVLDLGTGPGTLLLAVLDQWPAATGVGVDRSPAALAIARRNADRLGMADRVRFVAGNWASGIDARFDLVLCNPPYIDDDEELMREVRDHEPREALFAGRDGLDAYRVILPELCRLLTPSGAAIVEIGYAQADAVTALAEKAGLAATLHRDLGGQARALTLLEA